MCTSESSRIIQSQKMRLARQGTYGKDRQGTYQRNIEARSRNHSCRRKAVSITCSEGDFPPVQTRPRTHSASCKMDTGFFPGVKCGRGVLLTTHPLLVPRSWKSRAVPLPTLWVTPGL